MFGFRYHCQLLAVVAVRNYMQWMCVDVCGCVWMCVDVCACSHVAANYPSAFNSFTYHVSPFEVHSTLYNAPVYFSGVIIIRLRHKSNAPRLQMSFLSELSEPFVVFVVFLQYLRQISVF
jgi:hypothetical protein